MIARVLAERITFMPGGRALVATMKANGGYAALVSGGFTAFTGRWRRRSGSMSTGRMSFWWRRGGCGVSAEPILGREAKVRALEEITARLGLAEAEVMAVGDGANDLGMLKRAGAGVALHAKPVVAAEVDIRVNHGDLSALLYIQGYSRDEFAG